MYFKYIILFVILVQSHLNQTITLTYGKLKELIQHEVNRSVQTYGKFKELVQHEVNRSVHNILRESKYGNFCGTIKRECLQVTMKGN